MSHREFFIISESNLVGPSQLAEAQQTSETGVEKSVEKEVIVKGGWGQVVANSEQICNGEWRLMLCGRASILFCSCQGSVDKSGFAVLTDIREVWFELVAYAGEVGVDGLGVDVKTLKCGVVAEGLRGGFDW